MPRDLDKLASEFREVKLSREERERGRRILDAFVSGSEELHKNEPVRSSSRGRKRIIVRYIGIGAIVLGAVLAYWLISPLFITTVSDEKLSDLPNQAIGTRVIARGEFTDGEPGHHGQGTAVLLRYENGTYAVRFEDDFEVTNGPDLFVYFGNSGAIDTDARIAALTASKGGQNYLVPEHINVDAYNEIWVWCRAFGVNFASAVLEPHSD